MQPLVSIIIPVYNLEGYLGACLRSVMAQTYTNWEAVCIDDGSTDGSFAVLCDWQAKDVRIRALHYENGGVSAARNRGMEEAKCDYFFFLDGDDVLHPQAVELLVQGIQSGNYDIVISNYQRITHTDVTFAHIDRAECRTIEGAALLGMDPLLLRTACTNLFRRETALSARFPTGYINSEDTHYMFHVLASHVRLGFLDLPLYGYLERPDSVTMHTDRHKMLPSLNALHECCTMLQGSSEPLVFGIAMQTLFKDAFSLRMFLYEDKEAVRVCKGHCKAFMPSYLRCRAMPLQMRVMFYALYRSPLLYKAWRISKDPTLLDYFKKHKGE